MMSKELKEDLDFLEVPFEKKPLSTIRINQIRNYARFCLSRTKHVNPYNWDAFTPEERMFYEKYNDTLDEIKHLKIGLFTHFYEQGLKAGSTLKPAKNSKLLI